MTHLQEGDLLWEPDAKTIANANLTHYMAWLKENHTLHFANYQELWQWSVTEVADFWHSLWHYFDIQASEKPTAVLPKRTMPQAQWFADAKLNYAQNIFHKMRQEGAVIIYKDELGDIQEIDKATIWRKTAALANALRSMGIQKGDRVVAYIPNIPEAIIGLLAVSSIGAVWSSCSPDFGSRSVLDRFIQIEPKVLLTIDGYTYNGKPFNRIDVVQELQANLPTLEQTILVSILDDDKAPDNLTNTHAWENILEQYATTEINFTPVSFHHPLWVLYSSGTTGLPKPIVQGQGGIIMEHIKATVLHLDLKPQDRFFWYTSTGWMMWNLLTGGLLSGASIIIYNGSPAYPDINALWQLAHDTQLTYFGTSAAFISACIKAEIQPNQQFDLSRIRAVGSTGSPLSLAGFEWVYENINQQLALESLSGGTDVCTAFVGGARTQPIYAGEIQGASLGCKVLAYDEAGNRVIDEVGELVITEPMPSMPIYFWNDKENERYKASYYEMYEGVWRHGDWIKFNERGGCVIYGRSDSTINRQGIRMGTSEIYQAVESLDEILDSLIVDLELLGREESYMPLFVVLREGVTLDEELYNRINRKIRADISPRHVPNEIIQITQIPYTLSGKKMEVPIRKILLGHDIKKAANVGAMRNPEAIQFFIQFAEEHLQK